MKPAPLPMKPAEVVADGLYEWLVEHGQDENILILGGDSTNSMSGWKGGSIALLEKKLNRRTFWVICMIHINELPLRHLVETLDGKTSSKGGFMGPIGRKLPEVNLMTKNSEFPPIPFLEPLSDLPEDIVKNISTDASLSYQLVKSIAEGKLPAKLAGMKVAARYHSRWLTTGMSLLALWTTDHGFSGEVMRKFELIVNFIVQVYFPLFFENKVNNSIVEAPYHVLKLLRLLKLHDPEVQEAV